MKLTQENITFINNYLLNSGVEYIDLRMELIDHVASELEIKIDETGQGFYDAFKNYMIANKKEILRIGRVNQSFDFTLALKNFFRIAIQKENVLSFLVLMAILIAFTPKNLTIDLSEIYAYLLFGVIIFTLVWMIYFRLLVKQKYFALENHFAFFFLFYHFISFFRFSFMETSIYNLYFLFALISIYLLFMINVLKITFDFIKKNKNIFTQKAEL